MRNIKKIDIRTIKKYRTKKERIEEEKKRKLMDRSPLLLIIYIIGMIGIVLSVSESVHMFSGAGIMIIALSSFRRYTMCQGILAISVHILFL